MTRNTTSTTSRTKWIITVAVAAIAVIITWMLAVNRDDRPDSNTPVREVIGTRPPDDPDTITVPMNTAADSTKTRTCGRCSDHYKSYTIWWTDSMGALLEREEMQAEFGNVCPDCLEDVCPSHGYAVTDTSDEYEYHT